MDSLNGPAETNLPRASEEVEREQSCGKTQSETAEGEEKANFKQDRLKLLARSWTLGSS